MQNKFLQQMQQLWARLNPRQRLIVGGGTAATVFALFWLTRAFATPEYKPLMVGLQADDAQAISTQLAAKKIAFQMTPDGKGINVAADQLDAARMEVASEGAPHSGRMGFELFDKTSWGQTEFDEKVNYQRAMEGELERTIGTLKGVKSARVHLVMPHSSVFLDRERGAKASVTLRMKRGALTEDQLEAITRLVSGAVDDLKPSDVAIVDADSNESLGHRGGTAAGREIEAELSKRLVATLGPAVGTENLRASVNVEYDLSTSEESQDKYDPAVSAVLQSQKTSEQTGTGSAATGGVAGTASNVPGLTPMGQKLASAGQLPGQGTTNPTAANQDANAGGDDSSQTSTSENAVFGVNKIVRHTMSPAGRIRRLTAAILVNDVQDRKLVKGQWVVSSRKRNQEQLDKLGDLAKAVLGADPQRGDVVSVQNLTFDDASAPEAPPSALERVREGLHDYSGAVRYGGLVALFVLVWALMFRPVQKQVVTTIRELAAGAGNGAGAPQLAAAGAPAGALNAGASQGVTVGALTPETDVNLVRRNLTELVQAEPVAMTRTLQAWLREDGA